MRNFFNHSAALARAPRNKTVLSLAIIGAIAAASVANVAQAADDTSLTWNGVTLYGTLDVGVAYQNHGTPLSQDFYTGLEYLISKNSNKSITSVAPNGLSQSKVGLKGTEEIQSGLNFVFNLELGFNPQSGKLSDALGSLVHNNGVAQANQTTAADGSRAGQVFNGPAFAGFSSADYGTLTIGRHNTLLTDTILKYDPQGGSYAFSVIGYSGATAGGGNTENVRLDDSLKYTYKYQNFHFGALYQFGKSDSSPGKAGQVDVGADFGGLSIDGVYAFKDQSISASSLSATQIKTLPIDSLAATVSDNESYTLAASYKLDDSWKFLGGWEHITYKNPSLPLEAGFSALGGYYFSVVNNTAYTHHKELDVSWVGAKYQITPELSLTGAYYHYDQNSYSGNGCSNNSAGSCSGSLDAFSAVLDYRFNKRFDTYAGVMYSKVSDGLSSGYLYTSSYDPMIGFRFQF